MTPAERQRRHRAKKYAEQAERAKLDQSLAAWFEAHRLRPGDLEPFDSKDFKPFTTEDFEPFTTEDFEPWKHEGD